MEVGTFSGQASPVAHPAKQRVKRWLVTGAPYWEFDANGWFYYHRERVPLPDGKVPLIDLGRKNASPVLPAYADGSQKRFADELVCWEFFGPIPISLQRFVSVEHLDGNLANCAVDNVRRYWDADVEDASQENRISALMSPGNYQPTRPTLRTGNGGVTRDRGGALIPNPNNCPPWLPPASDWALPNQLQKELLP